jgi:hypothetical protein
MYILSLFLLSLPLPLSLSNTRPQRERDRASKRKVIILYIQFCWVAKYTYHETYTVTIFKVQFRGLSDTIHIQNFPASPLKVHPQ